MPVRLFRCGGMLRASGRGSGQGWKGAGRDCTGFLRRCGGKTCGAGTVRVCGEDHRRAPSRCRKGLSRQNCGADRENRRGKSASGMEDARRPDPGGRLRSGRRERWRFPVRECRTRTPLRRLPCPAEIRRRLLPLSGRGGGSGPEASGFFHSGRERSAQSRVFLPEIPPERRIRVDP